VLLRRSAPHERARWRAAQTHLQRDRGSRSKFVQLCSHHFALRLSDRGHFQLVSLVGFLSTPPLAPLLGSGRLIRAGVNAAMALTDLETFLF